MKISIREESEGHVRTVTPRSRVGTRYLKRLNASVVDVKFT